MLLAILPRSAFKFGHVGAGLVADRVDQVGNNGTQHRDDRAMTDALRQGKLWGGFRNIFSLSPCTKACHFKPSLLHAR